MPNQGPCPCLSAGASSIIFSGFLQGFCTRQQPSWATTAGNALISGAALPEGSCAYCRDTAFTLFRRKKSIGSFFQAAKQFTNGSQNVADAIILGWRGAGRTSRSDQIIPVAVLRRPYVATTPALSDGGLAWSARQLPPGSPNSGLTKRSPRRTALGSPWPRRNDADRLSKMSDDRTLFLCGGDCRFVVPASMSQVDLWAGLRIGAGRVGWASDQAG